MAEAVKEWFESWFGSRYYNILYKNRDEQEAAFFLDNLMEHLRMREGDKVLDIPCGKGRHSIYLANKGLQVTGVDLSKENIQKAKQRGNENVDFYVHDMRRPVKSSFNFVLNLFTSFGYFSEEENKDTLFQFSKAILPGGKIVIDFMNTAKVLTDLVEEEITEKEGVNFKINREVKGKNLVKTITVIEDGETKGRYCENIKILYKEDFFNYFKFAGLKAEGVFGTYDLKEYKPETSERMIFILRKA